MKKLLQWKLKIMSKMILSKYKPIIIGITGSLGKTSARQAIHQVVSTRYRTNEVIKNYNNEIGLPLTIIGEESAGSSMFGWIKVVVRALTLILKNNKQYPEVLVLEFGIDRPGDMKYLTSIADPKIGVITRIAKSHAEFFGTIEDIKKEKEILVADLKEDGWAVYNYDDELSKQIGNKSRFKSLGYGFNQGADVRATELEFNFDTAKTVENLYGMGFQLNYKNDKVEIVIPEAIGYQAVYAALAGASVGLALGIDLVAIQKALKKLVLPAGRMRLVDGVKGSMIVDDSYNSSSPESVFMALDVIVKIRKNKNAKKYAILGDMLELGSYSEAGHESVGEYIAKSNIDILITVGKRSKDIARAAIKAGMSKDDIFKFSNSDEVGEFLEPRIVENDILLVKGSQGMRMEKIVKEIMNRPEQAEKLLVRQGEEWIK